MMDDLNRKRTADMASQDSEHVENNTENTKLIKCEDHNIQDMSSSAVKEILDAANHIGVETEKYREDDANDYGVVNQEYLGYHEFGRLEAQNSSEVERSKNTSGVRLCGSHGPGATSQCKLFGAPEIREAAITVGTNPELVSPPTDAKIFFKNGIAVYGESQLRLLSENYRKTLPSPVGKKTPKETHNVPPRQNIDDKWLVLNVDNRSAGGGKWVFLFDEEDIDRKWLEVEALVEKKKLVDIKEVVSSTKQSNINGRYKQHSILFVCGPADEKEHVMEVGSNLLEIFPPHSSQDSIKYSLLGSRDN